MTANKIEIYVQYYALLREKRGISKETIQTSAQTAHELYVQLRNQYQFPLSTEQLRVAINNEFVSWDTQLESGDTIIFIPPVAGG